MMHPDTERRFVNDMIGHGVFATAFIPKGTIVWVLDELDRIMAPDEVRDLPLPLRAVVERYAYVAPDGQYILCWDDARYMNHSCRPTSRGVGDAFEIAVRDIVPGEELTCEYGILNLSGSFDCACGAMDCRGMVGGDDLERLWATWDREAEAAFTAALATPQPLLPYAKASARDLRVVDALLTGRPVTLPSSREYKAPDRPATGGSTAGLWRLPDARA